MKATLQIIIAQLRPSKTKKARKTSETLKAKVKVCSLWCNQNYRLWLITGSLLYEITLCWCYLQVCGRPNDWHSPVCSILYITRISIRSLRRYLEYSSQLPRDGGSFYTNDTMDSCRPHYCATWPALLHAATLWLTSDFFRHPPPEENEKLAKKANEYFGLIFGKWGKISEELGVEPAMRLLFCEIGICMESLCNSRSVCPIDNVITCLRTLHSLLCLSLIHISEHTRPY